MIVLDTNVISELMKPEPSPVVREWAIRHARELGTTAITLAEIGYGIARLPEGNRKRVLESVANEVFSTFSEQVLPFDAAAADHYGPLVNSRESTGTPINGFDAQIAAICRATRSPLATRNVKDFIDVGIEIVDPWQIVL